MRFIIFTLLTVFVIGCSGNRYPVITNIQDEIVPKSIGPFSAYSLSISSDEVSAELTPMRAPSLGESYTVSGDSLFRISPCQDCLKIKSVALDGSGNIALGFILKHPFSKGDDSEPPSYNNRLDLDVFDIALVVIPTGVTPTNFSLTDVHIYDRTILNADGYTPELSEVINDNTVIPYKICCENPENNRFEMGFSNDFEVVFTPGDTLEFDLYLTMGYGASAKKFQRLDPIYYVPEFNRKAAWKVEVVPSTWTSGDTITEQEVMIDVYDWNHGATVSSNFPDLLHTNYISASSDIESVTIEVPGMLNSLVAAETVDTITNGWDDPITYTASFANENGLDTGEYIGLVKVTDSRDPGTVIDNYETDTLVHVPDGFNLEWYNIPEFATYQVFNAIVQEPSSYIEVLIPNGGEEWKVGSDHEITWTSEYITSTIFIEYSKDNFISDIHIIITGEDNDGSFMWENIPNDPSNTVRVRISSTDNPNVNDVSDEDFSIVEYGWAKTWGGNFWDYGHDVTADGSGNIYVTGWYGDVVDFDPGPGEDWHTSVGVDAFLSKFDSQGAFLWAKTWGGGSWDWSHGVRVDNLGNVYVTGHFSYTVDFDPGPGEDWHISNGDSDVFLSKFDSSGNFIWAKTWGGNLWDYGIGVATDGSGNIYVTGMFGETVDFDPGPGEDWHTSTVGGDDVFLSKFDSSGNFIWAKTWDGSIGIGMVLEGDGGVATDGSGSVFVAGTFYGTVDFDPGPGEDWHTTVGGGADAFLSKFDSNGNFIWAKTWGGGSDYDHGIGVATDSSGNIYVTGMFGETVDFDPGPGEDWHTAVSGVDAFLSKFDSSGAFLWAKTWGGNNSDIGYGVATDGSDNIYVVGVFSGTVDFDPGPGEDWHTDGDAFLSKFDSSGAFIWAKTWGGTMHIWGDGVAVDSSGNSYVTGAFGGTVDFDPSSNEDWHASNGDFDAFLSKFLPDGSW